MHSDRNFQIGFDVDLESLTGKMNDVNKTVERAFESKYLSQFVTNINNMEHALESVSREARTVDAELKAVARDFVGATRQINLQEAFGVKPGSSPQTWSRELFTPITQGVRQAKTEITGMAKEQNILTSSTANLRTNYRNVIDTISGVRKENLAAAESFRKLKESATMTTADRSYANSKQTPQQMYSSLFDQAANPNNKLVNRMTGEQQPQRKFVGGVSAGALAEDERGFDKVNKGAEKLNKNLSFMEGFWGKAIGRFAMHLAQWTAWLLIIDTAHEAIVGLEKELHKGLNMAGEFQQQGILFAAAQRASHAGGMSTDKTNSNQLLNESIKLAIKYGDNVNDVSQDVTQWYKATGNLNAALYMTGEALKFQIASGTDLEDTYRTLTALSQQAKGIRMTVGGSAKDTFNLTKTHELLNQIYVAATVAGAGMRQVNAQGQEMHSGMANSAAILLNALHQDVAAMGNLHLSMDQIIGLNQAMITAMGNTGREATGIAERMARLVGGIASLSSQAKANSIAKQLDVSSPGSFEKFRSIMNGSSTNRHFLDDFAKFYAALDDRTKNILATNIAGTRQFQTQAELTKAILSNYGGIVRAMEDKKLLDDVTNQMMSTFNVQMKQVNAEWQAMVLIVGQALLPAVQEVLKTASQILPNVLMAISAVKEVQTADRDITEKLASRYPKQVDKNKYGFNPALADQALIDVANTQAKQRGINLGSYFNTTPGVYDPRGRIQSLYATGDVNRQGLTRHEFNMRQNANERAFYEHGTMDSRDRYKKQQFTAAAPNLGSLIYGNTLSGMLPAAAGVIQGAAKESFGTLTKQYLTADAIKALREQARMSGSPESGASIPAATNSGKTKGMASDARLEADAIANLKDKYTGLIDTRRNNLTVIDDEIRLGERGVARYGANSAYMDQTIVGLKKKRNELGEEQKILGRERNEFIKMEKVAERKVHASKPGSTARVAADANLRRVHQELYAINAEWFRNKALIDDATDSVDKYSEQIVTDKYTKLNRQNDLDLANAQKAFSQAPSLGAKRLAMGPLSAEIATEIKTANDEIAYYNQHEKSQGVLTTSQETSRTAAIAKRTQLLEQQAEATKILKNETDNMNESLTKAFAASGQSLADSLVSGVNFKPADKTYYDDVFKVQRAIIDQKEEWKRKDKEISDNATTQTDAVTVAERNLNDATLSRLLLLDSVNLKLAEQKRRIENIQNSDLYKATDSALSGLGSSLSSGFMSQLTGQNASNNRVTQIDKVTQALQAQKNAENDIYALTKNHTAQTDAMHAIYMRNMDAEIAKSQQKAAAEKEHQANPNLLKKTFDDFSKSMVDGFIAQLKNKALGGLFNLDPNKEFRNSVMAFGDDVKNSLVPALGGGPNGFANSVDLFGSAASKIAIASDNLVSALQTATISSGNRMYQGYTIDPLSGGYGQIPNGIWAGPSTTDPGMPGPNTSGSVRTAFEAVSAAAAMGSGNMLAAGPGVSGIGAPTGVYGVGAPTGVYGVGSTSAGAIAQYSSLPMSAQQFQFSGSAGMGAARLYNGTTIDPLVGNRGGVAGFGNSLQDLLKIPKGGIGAGPGSLGKDLNIAGSAYALYNAVTGTNPNGTVGGFSHGIQGGIAGAKLGSMFGPVGTAIGAGVGFFAGLIGIGGHTPADQMPDKNDTARFTQYVGELQGSAATAYGPPYNPSTDPVQSQLKAPILDYIQTWVSKNLNSGNKDKKALAQKLDALYGHTPGQGLGFGHDIGDEWVKGGSLRGKYTDIYQQAMTDVQDVLQLDGSTATPQQLVGLNQYGAGSGFFPYSWDTPGYNMPAAPPGTGYPVSPGSGSGATGAVSLGVGGPAPSIGAGASFRTSSSSYAYSPSSISTYAPPTVINQTISLPVDGRMLARINQSYVTRANSQGYSNV